MTDDAPVSSLPGLGPVFEAECARAGIASAAMLRTLGTDAAYARLLDHGTRPHFIGYSVIEMALQGRPWNDCRGDERTALRARFDALVADRRAALPDGIEAFLDRAGILSDPR